MAVGLSRWSVGFLCWVLFFFVCASSKPSLEGTIILSSYRRLRFAFDIFCVELPSSFTDFSFSETRLTHGDGPIINSNGFFASNAEEALIFNSPRSTHSYEFSHLASNSEQESSSAAAAGLQQVEQEPATLSYGDPHRKSALEGKILAYVSERKGRPQVYFNLYSSKVGIGGSNVMVETEDGPAKENHAVIQHEVKTAVLNSTYANSFHGSNCKRDDNDDDSNNGDGDGDD
eukprot:c16748_g1_i1 orf=2-691(-)